MLAHPNIVVIFDAGAEDGVFFITMELVEGKSLQSLLDSGQMFPLPRVLHIMEQACNALQFAHERNVVHRDIKPANLMLTPDDTVKVTDFGTAKILQFGTVQQTAHVMGTPSYMSPEQVKGKIVDGRSDIFALGVVLYEMVTGEKPFPGQNITTVIYKIVNEEPVQPRDIDPSVHPGLNAVIMKALAKDPGARYQSCRELLEDLRNYRSVSVAPNPNATMPLGSAPHNTGTQGGSPDETQVTMTSRALNSRASGPSQTPIVRRTGEIAPAPEPKQSSVLGTVLAAIFLLAVIIFGFQKIRPVFQAARQQNRAAASNPDLNQGSQISDPTATEKPASADSPSDAPAEVAPTSQPAGIPVKNTETPAASPAAKSPNGLSLAAAEYKGRIEQDAAESHIGNRLSIKGSGKSLTLSGKLRPAEHGALLTRRRAGDRRYSVRR